MRFIVLFLFSLSLFVPASFAFDYFQLVLQWPPTYCNGLSHCTIPSPINFTIHGLWPSDSTKNQKIICPVGTLDINLITPLMSELQREWPNLNGDDKWFWSHEWEKHGMCSEKLLDTFSYFKTTLELKNSVDLLRYLAEANITPSKVNAYTVSDISAAIRSKTGFEPRPWCNKANMLQEISICVDSLAQNFIDCPQTLLFYQNRICPTRTKGVFFPL